MLNLRNCYDRCLVGHVHPERGGYRGQDRRIKGGLRAVFGYMTIERGGTRGGWFSFLIYICTGNFSHSYVNGRTDVPFYSVNLNLNTFYMDIVW